MKNLVLTLAFLLATAFQVKATLRFSFDDVFHIDLASARTSYGDATVDSLQRALDDFNAVVAGKPPRHAKLDRERPVPADGGTTYYNGRGYKLTILKSLNGMIRGKEYVSGYIYGPVVDFEATVMGGNAPWISYITFYPHQKLEALLEAHR